MRDQQYISCIKSAAVAALFLFVDLSLDVQEEGKFLLMQMRADDG